MPIFHFPQCEHELFWRSYDKLHAFLAHCDYCLEKWELLNTMYKGVNCETRAPLEHWNFYPRVILLIGWLRTLMNLRLVVLIFTFNPLASLIMPFLCAKFVIVMIMIVILVPIIFLLMVLLGLPI